MAPQSLHPCTYAHQCIPDVVACMSSLSCMPVACVLFFMAYRNAYPEDMSFLRYLTSLHTFHFGECTHWDESVFQSIAVCTKHMHIFAFMSTLWWCVSYVIGSLYNACKVRLKMRFMASALFLFHIKKNIWFNRRFYDLHRRYHCCGKWYWSMEVLLMITPCHVPLRPCRCKYDLVTEHNVVNVSFSVADWSV